MDVQVTAGSRPVDGDFHLTFSVGVDPDGPRTAADATIFDVNLLPGLVAGLHLQRSWLTAIRAKERCVQDRRRLG
jgi:hypothetical protein